MDNRSFTQGGMHLYAYNFAPGFFFVQYVRYEEKRQNMLLFWIYFVTGLLTKLQFGIMIQTKW